ncbi:ThiJ/PfpI family protein [Geobacillus sp. WSUCF1]|nr:ThiJ/PfpI family protein [Geobacillus sp. WSUCF1]
MNATYKDGTPIVKGKTVTSFTDEEEREVGLDVHMPFLLESTLRLRGANFVRGEKWTDFSVRDGNLITGQNPQSSRSTAEKVVAALEERA